MSTDRTRFASSRARDNKHIRRAQIAPLLAAGMSLRAISAATSIPMGAVHRAKTATGKEHGAAGGKKMPATSYELPISYVVKKNIGGVPQQIRRLTGSALFAAMFEDHAIAWLNKRGYLRWDQRGQGEAIIAAVNALIARQRTPAPGPPFFSAAALGGRKTTIRMGAT